MKFKKNYILILFLVFGLVVNNYAANLHIVLHDSTEYTVSLSNIENIAYKNSETIFNIEMLNGTNQEYAVSEIKKITFGNITQITEKEIKILKELSLFQNYPNPFNPNTTIAYKLEKAGTVSIKIYDIMGRLVKNIEDIKNLAGHYSVNWNGKDEKGNLVSSGAYFYRLITDSNAETKRMILLR